MSDQESKKDGTVCPLCGVGCRLEPATDSSRARGVAGPANPSGRLCRKGIGAFGVVDDDDRLRRPAIRRDGELRTVSWATAYDHIVERVEAVCDEHGPDALAFLGAPHCTNEENYLLQKLARLLGTNNVDNRSRLCHASTARVLSDRLGWPATTNNLEDLHETDVILVAGANPAERQPIAFNSFVRPAVTDGATLVHFDPIGNRTTRLADIHVAPRPGTDALVFDLLSERVIDADGIDEAFVDERTRDSEIFRSTLADRDGETAATVSDVDESVLDEVAGLLTRADTVASLVGTGIESPVGGTNAAEALLHLLLLTGNVGRPGTGLSVLRGLVNEQGAVDAGCAPDRLPGHQPVTDVDARTRVATEWGKEPPSTLGRTATELLAAFGEDVRGALVVGENPAISKRERDWVERRLDALDILVVLDVAASETTRYADVVLPAAAGVEKSGTFTNLERRVQRLRPTTTPPGDARPDFTILRDLGTRLVDLPDAFDYARVSEVFDEWARVTPTHAGVSFGDLDVAGRQWPFNSGGTLYGKTFDTTDGLAAFGTAQPVPELESEDGLHLVTGGRMSEVYLDHPQKHPVLRMHPADASERGIDSGEAVLVSNGDSTVETQASLDDDVRQGTVYLPAHVADPFLRGAESTVSLVPSSVTTNEIL